MSALDRFGTRLVSTRTIQRHDFRALNVRSAGTDVVRNAPPGVMVSQTWQSRDQPMLEQYSAQAAVNNAYSQEMYVYRCIDYIANCLAGLPFRAGMNLERRGSFSLTAPLARLLGPAPGSPNPMWSPAELWRYVAAQWTIMGKTAFAIGRDEYGEINALWPLAVQYLRPIVGTGSGDFPFVGYQWMTPGQPGYRTYTPDQVVYLWRKSLKDPLQPESVIEAAQLNISVLKMIEMYEYSFLKNNAEPSTIVTTKPFAEPEQRRAFRDQFVSEMTGYGNAGKTLFVESGDEDDPNGGGKVADSISVNRIGLTQAESQHSENRDSKKDDVTVAFGVPLSLLGDSTQSKFQNYDQDLRTFWSGTMSNLMRELGDAINTFVAPLLGNEVGWFETARVAALQPPKTFKPIDVDLAVSMNLLDRDEWRNDLGLPPADEVPGLGPVIYPYNTTTPAGGKVEEVEAVAADPARPLEIPAVTPAVDPIAAPPQQPTPLSAARARRAQRAVLERLDKVEETQRALETRSVRHAGGEGHQAIPSGHVTEHTPSAHVQKAFTAMLNTGVQSLFAEQAENAQARLNGRRGRRTAAGATTSVEALFDSAYWERRTAAVLEPFFAGLEELTPMFDVSPRTSGSHMGFPVNTAKSLGTDITAATVAQLGLALAGPDVNTAIADVFASGPAQAIAMVQAEMEQHFASPSAMVDRGVVQQALLDIHSGRVSADAALAAITGSAA